MLCCIYISIYAFFSIYIYGKRTFVLLSRQTINVNRRLLFQQRCPSMLLGIPQNQTKYLPVSRHYCQTIFFNKRPLDPHTYIYSYVMSPTVS